MSVGGIVVEACTVGDEVYIDTYEPLYRPSQRCAIYVRRDRNSEAVEIGDSVWWQSRQAFWTPQNSPGDKQGANFDIVLQRVGWSGPRHPSERFC